MSFARDPKRLNQQLVFNPPPAYYQPDSIPQIKPAASFSKGERFTTKEAHNTPGPGSYMNSHKEAVRKRLIEQSQKGETRPSDGTGASNIKISSIPSIPKKSATRVYQELAPGILILHQEEYQNATIGPGTYNATDKLLRQKAVAHKIAPEHKPKRQEEDPPQVKVPTINQELRNERRNLYKQHLAKASTINKSQISPSDLCLQVIILREKLLRSDDNPPPGYYHQENQSSFKNVAQVKMSEVLMGGKEKRFAESPSKEEGGPAAYQPQDELHKKGGFIGKVARKLHENDGGKPGPGSYLSSKEVPKQEAKGNYPPIFGSGANRFPSAPKTIDNDGPGPGSYQIAKKKPKKKKFIKVRKELIEQGNREQLASESAMGIQSQFSHLNGEPSKERKYYSVQRQSSNFASKVARFGDKGNQSLGPGNYDLVPDEFTGKSFNKGGYIGSRGTRFDQTQLRPKIGPGAYKPGYDTVKQKKIKNVFM